jgi:aconitate hydratase
VLTVTQMLRKKGVVGKFVEFYGPGLDNLTLADRATIANMAPEYGATCGFFPIDERPSLSHHRPRRRRSRRAGRSLCQGAGHVARRLAPDPVFTDTLELDLGDVEPSSPARSVRRTACRSKDRAPPASPSALPRANSARSPRPGKPPRSGGRGQEVRPDTWRRRDRGDHLCTNTSNPSVLIAAGLRRAQRARAGPDNASRG